MSEAPEVKDAPAAPAKKSGALKFIVIGVVLFLLLAGGGAAAWWFLLRTPPAVAEEGEEATGGEEAGEHQAKPVGGGIVPMEQFLVNLADPDATRFVRVKIGLVVETAAEAKEIEEDEVTKARLRSAVLELLTQQTSGKLVTPEGKEELKKAIAAKAKAVLGGKEVFDVLFTDFVVQY